MLSRTWVTSSSSIPLRCYRAASPSTLTITHPQSTPTTTATTTTTSTTTIATASERRERRERERVYPIRKQFLYESYTHLLGTHDVCLLFRHHGLTPPEWKRLRYQLLHHSTTHTHPDDRCNSSTSSTSSSKVQVQVLRTGLVRPVLRRLLRQWSKSQDPEWKQVEQNDIQGPLCVLLQRQLTPYRLAHALNTLHRLSPSPSSSSTTTATTTTTDHGKGVSWVGGWIERQVIHDPSVLNRIAQLPTLDQLRHELVSLLQMPSSAVVSTLQQASGGTMVSTLTRFVYQQQQQEQQEEQDQEQHK